MSRMAKWIDWISHKLSFLAMVGMMILILVEVFLRGIFGISTLVAQEYTSYMLIFFVFVCLAHVTKKERHIQIVLITSHLPLRIRNILDILMFSMTLLLVLYIFYWTLGLSLESYRIGEKAETVVATPLAIPKAFIPFGCLMFAIQLFFSIVQKIKHISSPPRLESQEEESLKIREQM